MFRDTGDFKVSLGNTTWQVRSVYFDSPNPAEKGAFRVSRGARRARAGG